MRRRLYLLPLLVACASNGPRLPAPIVLPEDPAPAECLTPAPADTVWPSDSLDSPLAVQSHNPAPYPKNLLKLGLSGSATLRFRIQPSGRVDPCSVVILPRSDGGFEEAGRAWLLSTTYFPPLKHGAAVYTLHEQTFRFKTSAP